MKRLGTLWPHKAKPNAKRGQPLIGIVRAQREPIFRPTGEHAVGLANPTRDQIVDHHPDIGLVATQDHGVLPVSRAGSIQPRHETLRARFLIARRAIDLTGKVQAGQALRVQAGQQFTRIDIVIFDGVAVA